MTAHRIALVTDEAIHLSILLTCPIDDTTHTVTDGFDDNAIGIATDDGGAIIIPTDKIKQALIVTEDARLAAIEEERRRDLERRDAIRDAFRKPPFVVEPADEWDGMFKPEHAGRWVTLKAGVCTGIPDKHGRTFQIDDDPRPGGATARSSDGTYWIIGPEWVETLHPHGFELRTGSAVLEVEGDAL
jgi:hypothetical protein